MLLSALLLGCLSSEYDIKKDDGQRLGTAPVTGGTQAGAPTPSAPNGQTSADESPPLAESEPAASAPPTAAPCNKATAGPFFPQAAITQPQPAKSTSWGGVGFSLPQQASFNSSFLGAKHSDFLTVTHFGAKVPATAVVVGVSFALSKYSELGTTQDEHAGLTAKGAPRGSPRTSPEAWPTVIAARTYGGDADPWGTTLTGADVNDPDFGFSLSAVANSNLANAGVKDVSMTVTYCK